MDSIKSLFALPKYAPAIGDQQAAQVSTGNVRAAMLGQVGSADPSGLEFEAYRLAEQALGRRPLSRQDWQLMYRHSLLMDGINALSRMP